MQQITIDDRTIEELVDRVVRALLALQGPGGIPSRQPARRGTSRHGPSSLAATAG